MKEIASITDWKEVKTKEGVGYYGSIEFTLFIRRAKEHKLQHLLKQHLLVDYKTANKDGQLDYLLVKHVNILLSLPPTVKCQILKLYSSTINGSC